MRSPSQWVENLQELMEKNGFNKHSLSKAAGLNVTAVRDMVTGRVRYPRYDTVMALSNALRTTPEKLMGYNEQMVIKPNKISHTKMGIRLLKKKLSDKNSRVYHKYNVDSVRSNQHHGCFEQNSVTSSSVPSTQVMEGQMSKLRAVLPTNAFEDYLEQANAAKNVQQLFNVFKNTINKYGYDRILFGLLTDHKDIGVKQGVGILQNYPEDWMKYYFEKAFHEIDPIVTYGVHQHEPFEWSKIEKKVELHHKQKLCLNLGQEAGLNNGISVPLRGQLNQAAGISLATSEKVDACNINRDLLTAFCYHFYIAYKRLHKVQPINPENIILTATEKQILVLAATGINDEEIASRLSNSKHTVNMHFRNIYKKLETNHRIPAVVKALSCGLITL